MTTLYNRAYQLRIGTPDNPGQLKYGTAGLGAPLRVAFEVEKNLKGASNKGKVMVFNLAQRNRAQMQAGLLVSLSAGYYGALGTLFNGVVATVKVERQGAEMVTTLECGDGESAISQTFLHRSYPAGTPTLAVFQDIAAAMGLVSAANPTGLSQGSIVGLPGDALGRGLVLAQPCHRALDVLCRPRGLEWSVQNGGLQIVPRTRARAASAELVSAQTGLLGVPNKTKLSVVTFDCLLNPKLAPGGLVYLRSESFTGTYKIRGGKWEGDSHAEKWQASLEAVALPGVRYLAPLPTVQLG